MLLINQSTNQSVVTSVAMRCTCWLPAGHHAARIASRASTLHLPPPLPLGPADEVDMRLTRPPPPPLPRPTQGVGMRLTCKLHTQVPKCSVRASPLSAVKCRSDQNRFLWSALKPAHCMAPAVAVMTAVSCRRQLARVMGGTSLMNVKATPAEDTAHTCNDGETNVSLSPRGLVFLFCEQAAQGSLLSCFDAAACRPVTPLFCC